MNQYVHQRIENYWMYLIYPINIMGIAFLQLNQNQQLYLHKRNLM